LKRARIFQTILAPIFKSSTSLLFNNQKFEVFQEPSKPKQPTFEVFQEPPAAKPKPFEIFQESSAPTAKETKFEIFQDKENQLVSKPKPVIRDENDFLAAEPKFQKTRKSGTHFIIY
jgi:hypothetical protein